MGIGIGHFGRLFIDFAHSRRRGQPDDPSGHSASVAGKTGHAEERFSSSAGGSYSSRPAGIGGRIASPLQSEWTDAFGEGQFVRISIVVDVEK